MANDPTAAEALFLAGAEAGRVGRTARADVSEKKIFCGPGPDVLGVFRMRAWQHTVLSKYMGFPSISHLFLGHSFCGCRKKKIYLGPTYFTAKSMDTSPGARPSLNK